jgi:two-component sensor histidine kinase/PAS domain-containing protein
MLAAVETLAALPNKDQHPLPLPIARRDEVGELIGAFNRLLDALRQREDALRANEAFTASILNSVSAEIAVLDGDGIIVAVNSAWRRFALENAEEPGKPPGFTEVGTDYLAVCEAAGPSGSDGDAALRAAEGIRAVMAGAVPGFRLEYPCHTPEHQRWFSMSVTPLGTDRRGVVIAHTDITELRQAEAQRLADARQHRDTLVREVHHRIKNNLQSVAGLLRRELGRFLTLDPRLETAISQVHAIAAVHGLQSADSDEVVRLCDSTRDICASVAAIAQRPVEFRIENEATTFLPVRIASDEAVSVALVLNELILNAVKHSPEGGPAPSVTLTANGIDARIRIRNAVASPPTFDIDSGAGLGTGLRLVRSLLPAHGAHLGYETNTAGLVHTVLALTSPVVATSGAKLK